MRRASRSPAQQRGFTLMEAIAALILVSAALVTVAQTVAVVARQRQRVERQAQAGREVANALEHLYALPWNELTPAQASTLALSPAGRQQLPQAAWKVAVQTIGSPPAEQRILVALDWQESEGGRSQPVQLRAWRFAPEGSRP